MSGFNVKLKTQPLIQRKLCELNPHVNNSLLVALVLNKSEPYIFLCKNDTQYRGVINFTLRDDVRHLANCKFWGSREKAEEYYKQINLGTLVDVICPKIVLLPQYKDVMQRCYQPKCTLTINLILNEGEGQMKPHKTDDLRNCTEMLKLWHDPHKPPNTVMKLADIKIKFQNCKDEIFFTDLLVVIGQVKPLRELKRTADNKSIRCIELIVFDRSLITGIIFTIWQPHWIDRAIKYWKSMTTILHLIDIKMQYSYFYKECIISSTSRSLIYEDPMCPEIELLKQFVSTMPNPPIFTSVNILGGNVLPKPNEIHTVMTVKQLYDRAEGNLRDLSEQFTAILYAMITHFDFDRQYWVMSKRCKICQRPMRREATMCEMEKCQLHYKLNDKDNKYEWYFNMNLHFSDHTGTLIESRLSDTTANRVLSLNCTDYLQLTDDAMNDLKWSFLMNYFEVKLVVFKTNIARKRLLCLVVDMKQINTAQLAQHMTVY